MSDPVSPVPLSNGGFASVASGAWRSTPFVSPPVSITPVAISAAPTATATSPPITPERRLRIALVLSARGQRPLKRATARVRRGRSEEHTAEIPSRPYLVCRLLL